MRTTDPPARMPGNFILTFSPRSETLPSWEQSSIGSGRGVRDLDGIGAFSVEFDRTRPSDDGIGVAGLSHSAQRCHEKRLADALSALCFVHTRWAKEALRDSIVTGKADDALRLSWRSRSPPDGLKKRARIRWPTRNGTSAPPTRSPAAAPGRARAARQFPPAAEARGSAGHRGGRAGRTSDSLRPQSS